MWCPARLLFINKLLGNELIYCRFRKPRRYVLHAPMPLPIIGDTRCVVVDIGPELLEGAEPISSIPSRQAAVPRDPRRRECAIRDRSTLIRCRV